MVYSCNACAKPSANHGDYLWSTQFGTGLHWSTTSNDGVARPAVPGPFVSDISVTFWTVWRAANGSAAQVAISTRIGNYSYFDTGPPDEPSAVNGFVAWYAQDGLARVNGSVPTCGKVALRAAGLSLAELAQLTDRIICNNDFANLPPTEGFALCRFRSHSSLLWQIYGNSDSEDRVVLGLLTSCPPGTVQPDAPFESTSTRHAGTFMVASEDHCAIAFARRASVLVNAQVCKGTPAANRLALRNFLDSFVVVNATEWHRRAGD